MTIRLIVMVALAVLGTLVCLNLPWHNLPPYLLPICSEGQELKKEAPLTVSLQPGIESPLFLGAGFRAVFLITLYYKGFIVNLQSRY